ncbi:MAG: hypothetical protein HYX53_05315 [Chloroflexi bacterium]|nr:hypothetical protein [Chloroflexota bacterium]
MAKPIGETPFARAGNASTRPDVGGATRLYSSGTVGDQGWKLFVGASESEALHSSERLFRRELEKPFTEAALLQKIRAVLDRG